MFRIKLSPLILFLIILFILVISVVFCKYLPIYPSKTKEGLISFNYSKNPDENAILPQYSLTNEINKIHDSIFFDQNNGNIIMLFGNEFEGQDSSIDEIGNSLNQMLVISRDGNNFSVYDLDNSNTSEEIMPVVDENFLSAGVLSIYSSWSFPNQHSDETYQLFYIPWGNATFIHVVDILNNKLISTQLYDADKKHFSHFYVPPISYPVGKTYTDVLNNKFVDDPCYNGTRGMLYKVGDFVGFDTQTGNLLIQKGSGASQTTDIYSGALDSNGLPVLLQTASDSSPYTPNNSLELDKRDFKPIAIVSEKESAIVIYMQYLNTTLISLLSIDPDNSDLLLFKNSVRFNPNTVGGVDSDTNNSSILKGGYAINNIEYSYDDTNYDYNYDYNYDSTNYNYDYNYDGTNYDYNYDYTNYDYNYDDTKYENVDLKDSENPPSLDSIISDYYKKYWDNSYQSGKYSDDFLLKTQIVPPICPGCPNCPSSTACTNCGGNGGSGILDNSGSSLASRDLGIGNTVEEVVEDVSELAGNVVGTAGNLAEKIVDETSGLLHSAGSGLKHAVDDLSRGGYHNGYGGPSKYSRNESTNTQDATESGTNPAIIPYSSYSNYTLPSAVIDPYSYQGALSSKGGNPLPITSDFSRFGR